MHVYVDCQCDMCVYVKCQHWYAECQGDICVYVESQRYMSVLNFW